MQKTLYGPYGIKLVLDTDEVFPDDPGNGTPAMVYYGTGSATYWCAIGESEVWDKQAIRLPEKCLNWLESQEIELDNFLFKKQNEPSS